MQYIEIILVTIIALSLLKYNWEEQQTSVGSGEWLGDDQKISYCLNPELSNLLMQICFIR